MKKLLAMMMALALLLGSFAFAEAASPVDELTSANWIGQFGFLAFYPDGTGLFRNVDNIECDLAWTMDGDKLHFEYNFYGKRESNATLQQDKGVPALVMEGGNAIYYKEGSTPATEIVAAEENIEYYALAMGEEVNLGFVKMSFNRGEVNNRIGGSMGWRPGTKGQKNFCLVGTVSNTGGSEINISNIRVEMVINGEYTYTGNCCAVLNESSETVLQPMNTADIYLYAEIPEDFVDSVTDCVVHFGLDSGLGMRPGKMSDAEFVFEVAMDAETIAAAKEGPVFKKTFIEECPILPDPTSYADMRQSGSGSSATNGKTTKIYYYFTPFNNDDEVQPMYDAYIAGLKADGFTVEETKDGCAIFDGDTRLATMNLENNRIHINVIPGNENLTERSAAPAPVVEESTEGMLSIGDTIELENVVVTLEDYGVTDEIYSCIKPGNGYYTYYEAPEGESYFYIFGTIENIGGEPVDIDNIYTEMEFDSTYKFPGDVAGVKKGNSHFVHELAPLSSTNFYVYYPVNESLLDSYGKCVVRLGFTKAFGIKFSGENGLYNFSHCDDVFEILIDRNGGSAGPDLTEYSDKATVKAVQQALNDAGYNCGTPDGIAGKNTAKAITAYQADNGLKQTGTITGQLLSHMGIAH